MKKLILFCSLFMVSIFTYAQDVWLQNHFSPSSGFRLSNSETVTVLVNNNSGVIMPSNTITVKYQVDNGTVVSQLLSANLTSGASWNFSFNVKADLSAFGAHIIKVWVERPGDTNNLNNELTWTVNNTCIEMNQPANVNVCGSTATPAINFTSNLANVGYTWTNSNPSIGLDANGVGGIPSFTAVNTGTSILTSTITVRPHYVASQTFNYTGAMQTYVVPAGVTKIKIDARGAQGESAIYNQPGTRPDDLGGKGGRVVAEYPVTAGQTIYVFVGGNTTGFNGGGNGEGSIAQPRGGDASDIRIGGTALTNRIIIAGGGGGGGNNCGSIAEPGGAGGGLIGEVGYQCDSQTGAYTGTGGTQSAGGVAGVGASSGGSTPATAGQLGLGGNAGIFFGTAAGGGGGGYYGGGGAAYGGGGGGSSYTDPLATSVVHTQGFQEGLGQIIISYYNDECGNAYDKTFTITVKPQPVVSSLTPANQMVTSAQAIDAIVPATNLTGTTFTWTRDNQANVTGIPTSGSGTISGNLINTTNTSQTVTFTVTPSADGCLGTPVTATVLVKLAQSISAIAPINKNYGDADFEPGATASSGLTVSYASADNSIAEAYQDASDNNKWKLKIKKAGTVSITASQAGNGNIGPATDVQFTLTIQPKALMVSATANNKVYDGTNAAAVNLSSNALTGDMLTLAYGTANFDDKNVGNSKTVTVNGITISGVGAVNYSVNPTANTTADITPFGLTVSATANNKAYDATNTATVNLSSNVLAGDVLVLSYTNAIFNDQNVGTGKTVSVTGISISGADAGNYTFNTSTGTTASITPVTLNISAQAKTKTYGDLDPALSYTSAGLIGTDAITGTLLRDAGANVGTYGIRQGTLTAGANYTISYTAANFNIVAKVIAITMDAKTKIYGDTDPAITFTATSLIGNDTFTGSPTRDIGENAGTYAIGQGTLTAGSNYRILFTPANLTINRATLTVTAANVARCFGQPNPSFALNYNGFKRSDNENSLTAKPQAATLAMVNSQAGSYPVTVSGGASDNYTFVYANGTLRVDALPTVTIIPSRQGSIGKGLTVQLTVTGGTSYSWANAQGIISGQNSASLTIRPTANTTYTVTVTNANGCSSTMSYAVTVADDLSILKATNLLSPNGDGVNDVWKVDNIDMYPQAVVRIFDKAGRIVYTKKGYDNTWDGTYNGQPLAESTYYYIVDLEAGKVLRGYITLVRDR